VEDDVESARNISAAESCTSFDVEADEEAREKLWEARHDAALAIRDLYPGMGMMTTDVCVPISDLPGALRHACDTFESRGLDGAILGHVGDGNYHAVFPVDTGDEADQERAEEVNAEIVDYALQRGGTCTGEHGIGAGKTAHLQKEHGDSLPLMREIKRIADPNGIMNPGKIFSGE
jgi:D-lactate dehydrogenase (cytochrome)